MLSIYKASAGSGKTFTLTQRYIDFLFTERGRNRHRKILAVTFTKKATAEMKERIIRELSKLAQGEESAYRSMLKEKFKLSNESVKQQANDLLSDILQDYSHFSVTTIDSFFQQIIRTFSRELGLTSSYNIELDDDIVLNTAIDDYFRSLPNDPKNEQIKLLLELIDENMSNEKNWNPIVQVKELCNQLLKEKYIEYEKNLSEVFEDKENFSNYIKWLKLIKSDFIKDYKAICSDFITILGVHLESEFKRAVFKPFHYNYKDIIKHISKDKDYENKTFYKFVDDHTACYDKTKIKNADLGLANEIHKLAIKLSNLLDGSRGKDLLTADFILRYLPYLAIINNVSNIIERTNLELNRLPISKSNKLLSDVVEQSDAPFVYDKTGSRISHFMIDEFQDTSSMQWHNFLPLLQESSGRGEENMIVGDTKQSIYRWRNSDMHLLQTQAQKDITQWQEYSLDANWRSNKTIVEQNNKIFNLLSKKTAELYLSRGETTEEITDIYKDVAQIAKHDEETGYVEYFFSNQKDSEDRKAEALSRLLDIVNDVEGRGIPLGRVAILVRKNSEAALVAQWLLSKGVKVMSSEGLLLTASAQVRIVINILKLLLNADDNHLRVILSVDLSNIDKQLSKTDLGSLLESLKSIALPDQIYKIISQLKLNDTKSASVFLDSLLDVVMQYSRTYATDTYSFLQWWEENGHKCNIPMPQVDDALSIVSVHRSKGLEYDIVIIPFYNWDVAESNEDRKNILWVHPNDERFNMNGRLPIIPIQHSNAMALTCFKEDYFREVQDLYIDNLNISYVAFTRAKHELYVMAPKVESASTNSSKIESGIKYVGGMLNLVLRENYADEMITDNENQIWRYGEKTKVNLITEKKQEVCELPVIQGTNNSLTIGVRLPSRDYFLSEDNTNINNTVNLGIVMHALLAHIVNKSDAEKAMHIIRDTYPLSQQELTIVKTELSEFFRLVNHTDWFNDRYEVCNEQELVLPDGGMRRPDRLMIKDNKAIIVDYKFGFKELEEYHQQVKTYMSILQQMGYQTEGYLCYVNLKKIVKV